MATGAAADFMPPAADVNIFGLQSQIKLAFMQDMMTQVQTACIFVRDSGRESALA